MMMRGMVQATIPKGRINEYTWSFPYDEKSKTFSFPYNEKSKTFDTSSFTDSDGEGVITLQELEQFLEKLVEQKD